MIGSESTDMTEILGPQGKLSFNPSANFKLSGVEWVGEIPAHWDVRRLKYLATVNDEALPETTDPDMEITYVDIGNVDPTGGITGTEELVFEGAPSRARRIVRQGDVIISTVRTYLKAIARIEPRDPNLIVSTGFAVIRPRKLDDGFLAYALSAPYFIDRVVAHSVGVSYPAINASELACLDIAFPPISEQQAISAFLDRETAQIDALVSKQERLIELLGEKRTAITTRAVTKGLHANAPIKDSGVKWLGEIPAHWEVKRLWHLTPQDRRIMYGIVLPGPHVEGGVPIVKGGDVAPDRLRLNLLSRTTREIERQYERSRLQAGDLVYAIRGSIGDVAMIPDELDGSNLTQDAARVSYTKDSWGLWLLHSLKSYSAFAQLDAGALGATIRGINIRDLKRILMPVPPSIEQRAIADYIQGETAKLDNLAAKVREAIERLKELRAALISAAVTGRIDVREDGGCT